MPTRLISLLALGACSPSASATVVELPPTEQPQPLPTPTVVLQQAPPRPLAKCEVPSDTSRCTLMARLRVGHVSLSSASCYVDARVREGEEGRLLQCPEGAVAAFSRGAFGGTLATNTVNVCLRTQFPFNDGCTWETMQSVRGSGSSLVFAYVERPITGQASGQSCASSSCTASAEIEVLPP